VYGSERQEQGSHMSFASDEEDDEYEPLTKGAAGAVVPPTPGEISEISDLDFSPVPPVGRKKGGDGGGAGGVQQHPQQQQHYSQQPPHPHQQHNPYAYLNQSWLRYSVASYPSQGGPPPGWNDSLYSSAGASYYFHQQPPPPMMMMYPPPPPVVSGGVGGQTTPRVSNNKALLENDEMPPNIKHLLGEEEYKVYSARWIMLLYMSMLNLLSDWTCSSKEMENEHDEDMTWRLYLGFFLVGLSQPLYQCTPALLSASWFPENERTMATGVALNSNQLGIGCAFVFGTILVETKEDIIPYFGLLSVISAIVFIGAALQFDDAPPTPPSDTARVIKGDLVFKIPNLPFFGGGNTSGSSGGKGDDSDKKKDDTDTMDDLIHQVVKEEEKSGDKSLSAVNAAPSPAPTNEAVANTEPNQKMIKNFEDMTDEEKEVSVQAFMMQTGAQQPFQPPPPGHQYPPMPMYYPGYYGPPPPINTSYQGMHQSSTVPTFYHGYDAEGHYHNALLETGGHEYSPTAFAQDEGAEPILTQLDHHLDIDIRDDQIVQQFKACFARKGFAHCIVAFTTSGIIVNTLSTFMDYLVTLNGADKSYVGIVGGTFQLFIMFASLVFGGWTDHSRKYYFVILAMLMLGAFALALCNTDLDSDAGGALRWHLLVVAILAGPLQPLSTELGVEVVYPLSENTVLVIQQLFSNLLSAAFIPVFKALKNVGTHQPDEKEMFEVPVFTFSFYMLIIIHAKKEAKMERILAEMQANGSYGAVDQGVN